MTFTKCLFPKLNPANTRRRANARLILTHRRRRWANSNLTLARRLEHDPVLTACMAVMEQVVQTSTLNVHQIFWHDLLMPRSAN